MDNAHVDACEWFIMQVWWIIKYHMWLWMDHSVDDHQKNMDILGLMGLTGNDIASLGASNFDLNNEMYMNGLICHYSLRSSWWFAKNACLEMEFLLYYKLYSTNVHFLARKASYSPIIFFSCLHPKMEDSSIIEIEAVDKKNVANIRFR